MKKEIFIIFILFFLLINLNIVTAQEKNYPRITNFDIRQTGSYYPGYSSFMIVETEDLQTGRYLQGGSYAVNNILAGELFTKEAEISIFKDGENELILLRGENSIKIKFNLIKLSENWDMQIISTQKIGNYEGTIDMELNRDAELEMAVLGGIPGAIHLKLKGLESGRDYVAYVNDIRSTELLLKDQPPGNFKLTPIMADNKGEAEISFKAPKLNYRGNNTILIKDGNNNGILAYFRIVSPDDNTTMFVVESANYLNEVVGNKSIPSVNMFSDFSALGEYVFVKGKDFSKNEEYTIYYNENEVMNVYSNENGYFTAIFELNNSLNPIIHTLNYSGGFFRIVEPLNKPLNVITVKQNGTTITSSLYKGSKERRQLFKNGLEYQTRQGIQKLGHLPPILFLNPSYGNYGDKIEVYGQGLEANKSYNLKVGYGVYKTIKVQTDEYGKFHISNVSINPPIIGRIWMFFKTLFGREPSEGEKEEIENQLKEPYSIEFIIKTDPAVFGSSGFGFSFHLCNQLEKRKIQCE